MIDGFVVDITTYSNKHPGIDQPKTLQVFFKINSRWKGNSKKVWWKGKDFFKQIQTNSKFPKGCNVIFFDKSNSNIKTDFFLFRQNSIFNGLRKFSFSLTINLFFIKVGHRNHARELVKKLRIGKLTN